MASQFTGPYQSIYEAAIARQREEEARQRGMAVRRAGAAGVSRSGVSEIPQDAISREALRDTMDIGANVAQAQEGERLQDKSFEQRKELMQLQNSMDEIAAAAERRRRREAESAGYGAQLISAGIGGIGSYLGAKYK